MPRLPACIAQFAVALTFALIPMWIKLPTAPPPFTATYTLGFVVTAAMLLTITTWLLSGFAGLCQLVRSKWRIAWITSLGILVALAYLSQQWAFMAASRPAIAHNATLQLAIVAAFALACASNPPPAKTIIAILIVSMLLHGSIGTLQVTTQSSIGLPFEFTLDPAESGVSVIQSGDLRWLRPYGLLPHPNILAGMIVVGLLASVYWLLTMYRYRWLSIALFLLGFWFLLLTFSRGAWLGFIIGALVGTGLFRRSQLFWQRIIPVIIGAVGLGVLFVALYQPLLISRAGVGTENTEMRSIADRIVFNRIAAQIIHDAPLRGVGAGNFPWYASRYLARLTDYDLRGDNVHNIYFLIWSELGLGGVLLLLGNWCLAAIAILRENSQSQPARILLAASAALLIIGLFDHYPITLPQTAALWFGLLAVALSPHSTSSNPTT